jgi:hypothetical protein
MSSGTKTTFRSELSILPRLAWFLAFASGICGMVAVFAGAHMDKSIPREAVPFLALLCGFVVFCWVLLLGYVNRDAARRGMSPLLWTLICIFVPNLLGFLIYFVVRKRQGKFCNYCGCQVDDSFRYCPRCGKPQSSVCGSCGKPVRPDFVCCPYCGQAIGGAPVGPAVTPAT